MYQDIVLLFSSTDLLLKGGVLRLSNVLARDRGLSHLTFYTHLMKTRDIIDNYLGNPDNFKARDFYTYCSPILRTMQEITQNIIVANSIFPINEHEVMVRRDFQNIAIGLTEAAITELQRLIVKFNLSLERSTKMREIIDALTEEIKYLKWWRKQNNILMRKFRENNSIVNSQMINGIIAANAKLGITPQPIQVIPYFGNTSIKDPNAIVPIYYLSDYEYQQYDNNVLNTTTNQKPTKIEPKKVFEVEMDRKKTSSTSNGSKKRRTKVDNYFDRLPTVN